MRVIRFTAALSSLAFAVSALGATAPAPATPDVFKILGSSAKIKKSFPVGDTLVGHVAELAGENSIIYTTKDGQYLIVGAVFDASGKALTKSYATQYIEQPDYSALIPTLKATPSIKQGKDTAAKTVYVFFDPNCIFCHFAWKATAGYAAAGTVQFKWVPLAFQSPTSAGKAYTLMQAKDPAALMAQGQATFSNQSGGLAVNAATTVPPEFTKQLVKNESVMNALGSKGTPLFVYADESGKWRTASGLPKLGTFGQLIGVPQIPVTDPDLKRYE